jgi:hypothetical protein
MSGIDFWTRWTNRLLWLMIILVVWVMDADNSGDMLLVPSFILPCMLTKVMDKSITSIDLAWQWSQ